MGNVSSKKYPKKGFDAHFARRKEEGMFDGVLNILADIAKKEAVSLQLSLPYYEVYDVWLVDETLYVCKVCLNENHQRQSWVHSIIMISAT